ncbi:hypothetical protein DXG03_009216 [Asterophora parasitica]|uniref:DUF6532 domain-containing protein n=1 Tax=Asterophora parasitica TaxID=117018 RepID=A0A9P7G1I2_9AGAR|nr:hypothetical protein DXG03_009216 [Asterophora parasitica]
MTMLTPFAPGRLENLASKAAIAAAEELGFDGEFDIADHIESNKSGCYSKPLVDHIRKAVKPSLLNVELGAIKGNMKGISEILTGSNYLYKKTEKGYNCSCMFSSTVLPAAVHESFFENGGIAIQQWELFELLLSSALSKVEVPIFMVALISTAIHAHLQHMQTGIVSNFSGKLYNSTYKAHFLLLRELQEKRPKIYHKQMYKIFKAASKNLTEMSPAQILGKINTLYVQVAANQAEEVRIAAAAHAGRNHSDNDNDKQAQKKDAMADFDEDQVVDDFIIPCPTMYAMTKLKACKYIKLWCFTEEGCQDVQTHGRTMAEEALGLKHIGSSLVLQPVMAMKALRNVMWDIDLTWSQVFDAKLTFLQNLEKAK